MKEEAISVKASNYWMHEHNNRTEEGEHQCDQKKIAKCL